MEDRSRVQRIGRLLFRILYVGICGTGSRCQLWSFNDVISTIVQAVGALVSLVSIVFLAASIAGHDTSQRVSAGLGLAAGLLIAFAPTILSSIGIGQ